MSNSLNPYYELPYRSGDVVNIFQTHGPSFGFIFDEANHYGILGGFTYQTEGVLVVWSSISRVDLVCKVETREKSDTLAHSYVQGAVRTNDVRTSGEGKAQVTPLIRSAGSSDSDTEGLK